MTSAGPDECIEGNLVDGLVTLDEVAWGIDVRTGVSAHGYGMQAERVLRSFFIVLGLAFLDLYRLEARYRSVSRSLKLQSFKSYNKAKKKTIYNL